MEEFRARNLLQFFDSKDRLIKVSGPLTHLYFEEKAFRPRGETSLVEALNTPFLGSGRFYWRKVISSGEKY